MGKSDGHVLKSLYGALTDCNAVISREMGWGWGGGSYFY